MAVPIAQKSFTTGELSPSLYGQVALEKYRASAATMRNMFVGYRGGAYSRAGTAFVGFSKQTGRFVPPRLIPFQFSISQGITLEFGNFYMRVIINGAFVTETPIAIAGISSGNPAVLTIGGTFNAGDWLYLTGIVGPTQLNNRAVQVTVQTPTTYGLRDVYGNNIDLTAGPAYVGGGTAARIYTLSSPYAEADLRYIKFIQSADVMSLTCVNQLTGTEYQPVDLTRITDSNWQFLPLIENATVPAPNTCTVTASGTGSVFYQYQVTAVSPIDGTESIASPTGGIGGAVNITATAGTITVTWSPVAGVNQYNIYKAAPGYGIGIPTGSLFGYAGSAYGTQFIDSNIQADFTQVPPVHLNPFARGQVLAIPVVTGGTGYTVSCTATINTATGTGALIETVVQNNSLVAVIVVNPGRGYLTTDTVTITGNGTGATASLTVGPQAGTYPAVVAYFQERRVYANSRNNPDTYWMSQPGSYGNFDARLPTIATDAIVGTPWSVQINGVQFMVQMPGGLVVLTGLAAWQLTGAGGSSLNPQPITPSSQQAQPQAYNGCSATVPPIKIDDQIIYVQQKGATYRDLSYNYFTNIYTGEDITQYSSHLFLSHTILEHAWCDEPFKVLWAIREDGVLLSMTFNKPQQVIAWARHDTDGTFVSTCSIIEPPVDALYVATQRRVGANNPYIIERMDDRLWNTVEDAWCVDCGLALPFRAPIAVLYASSAGGLGGLSGATNLIGGSGYGPNTTVTVVDDAGQGTGSGAVVAFTIAGGVITSITFPVEGSGYTFPALVINDPSGQGSGASATVTLDTTMTFGASANVFSAGDVGSIIRSGGGVAQVTAYTSPNLVTAKILTPITAVQPNSGGLVAPQTPGNWTIAVPVTMVGGLTHLAGASVVALADGNPVGPFTVSANGTITLPTPATDVKVGLPFQAQLQTSYLDVGDPTVQGQRKKIGAVTVRMEGSRGIKVGANQVDGQSLSPPALAPIWNGMEVCPDLAKKAYTSNTQPLYTGDARVPVGGGFSKHGQVAMQQDNCLPMNILLLVPEAWEGDEPETQAPQKGKR